MRPIRAFPLLLAFLLPLAMQPPSAAADAETQRSLRQGVYVSVTPASFDPDARVWEFAVAFHSEGPELRDDMLQVASLFADGVRYAPLSWEGTEPTASHHRVGVLTFAAVTPVPGVIEVRLQREGEAAPRVFRWTAHLLAT